MPVQQNMQPYNHLHTHVYKKVENGQLPVPKNYFETTSEIEIFVSWGKQIVIQNLEYLFCERNKYSRFIT